MEEQTDVVQERSIGQILEETFDLFFAYGESIVGQRKSTEFARNTYKSVESYFRSLSNIQFLEDHHIKIKAECISEKEILGFAIWMQQFLTTLKNFMIGLGEVDAKMITESLKEELLPLNFYEFFEQAKELSP